MTSPNNYGKKPPPGVNPQPPPNLPIASASRTRAHTHSTARYTHLQRPEARVRVSHRQHRVRHGLSAHPEDAHVVELQVEGRRRQRGRPAYRRRPSAIEVLAAPTVSRRTAVLRATRDYPCFFFTFWTGARRARGCVRQGVGSAEGGLVCGDTKLKILNGEKNRATRTRQQPARACKQNVYFFTSASRQVDDGDGAGQRRHHVRVQAVVFHHQHHVDVQHRDGVRKQLQAQPLHPPELDWVESSRCSDV